MSRRRGRSGLWACAVLLAVLLPSGSPAAAQQSRNGGESGLGFGLRGGLGIDPDQFVLGAQVSLGKAFQITRFVPSVDVAVGDVTTTSFNGDFLLRFVLEDASFGIYAGGGPTLVNFNHENDNTWELGLSAVAGTQLPLIPGYATNLEARFGVGDIPDFRLLFAIIF
ncbi:MAG: hypothetical protein ACE5HQ_12275 [Gemmatimonadota bacterium]